MNQMSDPISERLVEAAAIEAAESVNLDWHSLPERCRLITDNPMNTKDWWRARHRASLSAILPIVQEECAKVAEAPRSVNNPVPYIQDESLAGTMRRSIATAIRTLDLMGGKL